MKKTIVRIIIAYAMATGGCKTDQAPPPVDTGKPREPLKEYTREKPAEWYGLENEHVPIVTLRNTEVENIHIRVRFPVKHEADHYIQKIGVMDANGNDVIVKRFNPTADYYEAKFTVPFIGEGYKAYARCSLHDLWTAPLE